MEEADTINYSILSYIISYLLEGETSLARLGEVHTMFQEQDTQDVKTSSWKPAAVA